MLNDEFDLSCQESFSAEEYDAVFGREEKATLDSRSYLSEIEEIQLLVTCNPDELLQIARDGLRTRNLEFHDSPKAVTTYGAFSNRGCTPEGILVKIEPTLFKMIIPLLGELVRADRGATRILTVVLRNRVKSMVDKHKLTARLYGSKVQLRLDGKLQIGETIFENR